MTKVSKIMIWPSRTIDLGPRGYVKLSAGAEIELDPAAEIGSPEIEKAFDEARKIVLGEMKKQYEPYRKKK